MRIDAAHCHSPTLARHRDGTRSSPGWDERARVRPGRFDAKAEVDTPPAVRLRIDPERRTPVEQEAIRQKIRERLAAGTLPRGVPPLIGGPGLPVTPQAHIMAEAAIGLARCSGCDDAGARVTYRYADGTIIRFHGRCHRLWEEECQRPRPS